MAYAHVHVENLYKQQDILLFKECYALEKVHGTNAFISWKEGHLRFHARSVSAKSFTTLFDIHALTQKFNEHVGITPATLYGEAHGGKLMGMKETYGNQLRFVVF